VVFSKWGVCPSLRAAFGKPASAWLLDVPKILAAIYNKFGSDTRKSVVVGYDICFLDSLLISGS
jgi:hypothetical protein